MSTATTIQAQAPPSQGELRYVDLDSIILSTTNPRKQFDGPEFDELVASIRLHGVLQPVLLRRQNAVFIHGADDPAADAYELVAGERRCRAAVQCGILALPAYVLELSDAEAMELQIVENLQRKDVTALEEAAGFLALVERMEHDSNADGKTRPDFIASIAEKVGKSERYVYARIKLCSLAPEVKDAIASGRIPVSHGDELVRLPVAEQAEVLKKVCLQPTYDGTGAVEAISIRELKEELGYLEKDKKRKAEQAQARAKEKEERKKSPTPAAKQKKGPEPLSWEENNRRRKQAEEAERPLRELVVGKIVDQVKEFGAREIRYLVEHVDRLAWHSVAERLCKRFQWKPASEKTVSAEMAKLSPTSKAYAQAVMLAAMAPHLRPQLYSPHNLRTERAELVADAKLFGVADVQKLIDAADAALKAEKVKKLSKGEAKGTAAAKFSSKKAAAAPTKLTAKKSAKKAGRK